MLGGQHDTLPKPRNINGPPKEPSSHLHASACTCMLVRIHITTTSALHLAQGQACVMQDRRHNHSVHQGSSACILSSGST
eukprot:291409-Pelagomonas_calceolata.AAC.1